jgi:prephenate dehydrogenase (NADP+)
MESPGTGTNLCTIDDNRAELNLGIVGMGDMGRLYVDHFVKAGFKHIFACDVPEKLESLEAEYANSPVSIVTDGFKVVRKCDFTM